MQGYELTERGKIIVAIVLVLLLLLIPSAILLYTAMSGQAAPPPSDQNPGESGSSPPSVSVTLPPLNSESPPPNGGGFNPPEVLTPDSNGGLGEKAPSRPPGAGQPEIDTSEGTLSFFFSPSLQNTIDVETSSMLCAFLKSPKNIPDSMIAVEMPQLSGEDADKTISAIISAFAALGVQEQRLAFVTYPNGIIEGIFSVNLTFLTQQSK